MGCSTSKIPTDEQKPKLPAAPTTQVSSCNQHEDHDQSPTKQPAAEAASRGEESRHVGADASEPKQVHGNAEKAKYRLTKQIEKGSHSRIFEAYDRVTNERYRLASII